MITAATRARKTNSPSSACSGDVRAPGGARRSCGAPCPDDPVGLGQGWRTGSVWSSVSWSSAPGCVSVPTTVTRGTSAPGTTMHGVLGRRSAVSLRPGDRNSVPPRNSMPGLKPPPPARAQQISTRPSAAIQTSAARPTKSSDRLSGVEVVPEAAKLGISPPPPSRAVDLRELLRSRRPGVRRSSAALGLGRHRPWPRTPAPEPAAAGARSRRRAPADVAGPRAEGPGSKPENGGRRRRTGCGTAGDHRVGEHEDDDEVDQGGQAEGEGEAAHPADRQEVQHHGGEEADGVRDQDGAPGALPGRLDRRESPRPSRSSSRMRSK